jgi:hypothetical protein
VAARERVGRVGLVQLGPTARTDGHWPVSACGPGGTAAARLRDAGATTRTGAFPLSAYLPLTNNYSIFCN